jgi:hypothetical protein
MKQRNRLLCVLIQEMDGVPQVQSFVDTCERCERAVWRAESSNKRAIAICRYCVDELKHGGARVTFAPINKRQLDDIKEALK